MRLQNHADDPRSKTSLLPGGLAVAALSGRATEAPLGSVRSGGASMPTGVTGMPTGAAGMNVVSAPLAGCPALVLNADYRPLSYLPLSLWPWQEAVKAVFLDRVEVVAEYEQVVHSPSFEMRLPSVISLKEFVSQDRPPAFTRFNVFLRDGFACQYCGDDADLTFDHVIPRSKGGRTTWENIVTACAPCNLRKGGALVRESGMRPNRKPTRPNMHELQSMGRRFPPHHLHASWVDYLYWDVELEA